ncbi:MAG TPA: hypothetical protein VGP24_01135, partial [Glaciihabitans sp.]|nr:hypothetical protein [Glaciihabitans sp.]
MSNTKPFNVTWDLAYVVASLRALVTEFGFNHSASKPNGGVGCIYAAVVNRALVPVCIVGQFLAREGLLRVTQHEDRSLDYGDNDDPDQWGACTMDSTIWAALDTLGVTVTDEAKAFLREVQSYQDRPSNWGTALNEALDNLRERAEENLRDAERARDEAER